MLTIVRRAAAAAALAIACASASLPASGDPGRDAVARAASWLGTRQLASGQYAEGQTADYVAEAVSALAAARSTSTIGRALGFVRSAGAARARQRAAYAGRIVMGIVAGGGNPRSFGGVDYTAILRGFYSPVTGFYDTGNLYANALAVLGAIAGGERIPDHALDPFRVNECPGGGFGHEPGCTDGAHTDTTGLALCIFDAAGVAAGAPLRARARAAMAANAGSDGGYGEYAGRSTNANSTGLALSAIAAIGESPGAPPWRRAGGDPRSALLALQTAGGGFRFTAASPDADLYATMQAVPGAAAVGYPVPRVTPATPSVAAPSAAASRNAAVRSRETPAASVTAPATFIPGAAGADADSSYDAYAAAHAPDAGRPAGRAAPIAGASVALAFAAGGYGVLAARRGRPAFGRRAFLARGTVRRRGPA